MRYVMSLVLVAAMACQADAGWHHRGGLDCCGPIDCCPMSCGPICGPVCGPVCCAPVCCAPVCCPMDCCPMPCCPRIHGCHHRGWRGLDCCGDACCGPVCGGDVGCGCGGGVVGGCGCGGDVTEPAPVEASPTPAPATAPTPAPEGQPAAQGQTQMGRIVLHVAKSATVTINGRTTSSSGDHRVYLSQLEPGQSYRFHVQVTDGAQSLDRDVVLQAGQTQTLTVDAGALAGM
jgi:hypothetical protein